MQRHSGISASNANAVDDLTLEAVQLMFADVRGHYRDNGQLDEGQVTDAWTVGTMYRGFEQLLMRIDGECRNTSISTKMKRATMSTRVPKKMRNPSLREIRMFDKEMHREIYDTMMRDAGATLEQGLEWCGART